MSDEQDPPKGRNAAGPDSADGSDSAESGPSGSRAWISVGVLAAVVIALGVWFLVSNGDDPGDVTASSKDTTSTSVPATDDGSSTTSASTGDSAQTDDSVPQSTLPDEAAEGITDVPGAAITPVSVPRPADAEQATITSVRTARHEGFDRVVFEFDGPVPGYEVKYADRPIKGDASDEEVEVDGASVVTVRMTPASSAVLDADGYHESRDVPDRIPGAGSTVREVVEVGDFEGQATWAVGLADPVAFAVSTLQSPSRLVIDFVNH